MNPDTNVPAASPAASSSAATKPAATNPAPVASNQPTAKPQKGFGKKAKFGGNAPKL
jgi:hypothetical protein